MALDTTSTGTERAPARPGGRVPRWGIAAFLLGGAALLLIAVVASRAGEPTVTPADAWKGTLLEHPVARPDFSLTDTSGAPFSFGTQTAGELTILFYGYTHCPDVCPLTMVTLAQALDEAQVAARVVFVTTDPARDTPERLRSWLDNFDPRFVGLTGSEAAVDEAQKLVGMSPAIREAPDANGNYAVGHGAGVYVFTPDDQAHLVYPSGTRQEEWVNDLPRIAAESAWRQR